METMRFRLLAVDSEIQNERAHLLLECAHPLLDQPVQLDIELPLATEAREQSKSLAEHLKDHTEWLYWTLRNMVSRLPGCGHLISRPFGWQPNRLDDIENEMYHDNTGKWSKWRKLCEERNATTDEEKIKIGVEVLKEVGPEYLTAIDRVVRIIYIKEEKKVREKAKQDAAKQRRANYRKAKREGFFDLPD